MKKVIKFSTKCMFAFVCVRVVAARCDSFLKPKFKNMHTHCHSSVKRHFRMQSDENSELLKHRSLADCLVG